MEIVLNKNAINKRKTWKINDFLLVNDEMNKDFEIRFLNLNASFVIKNRLIDIYVF